MRSKPLCFHVQRGGDVEHVRVTALLKMGQALLSDHKRASRIYTVHQIKALHRRVSSSRQRYCRRVIDQNIDPPKMRNGMRNSRLHRGLIANINSNGQRTTASRFHFLCSGIYSARDPETKRQAAGGAGQLKQLNTWGLQSQTSQRLRCWLHLLQREEQSQAQYHETLP